MAEFVASIANLFKTVLSLPMTIVRVPIRFALGLVKFIVVILASALGLPLNLVTLLLRSIERIANAVLGGVGIIGKGVTSVVGVPGDLASG